MKTRPQLPLAVLLVAATVLASHAARSAALAEPAARARADSGAVRLRLASAGNEARYLVNEQLAGRPLRNDAVGRTTAITGQLVLDRNGRFSADSSALTVDLASISSDQDRRDNYVRRRVFEVEQYPAAVLRPRALRGLAWPLPASGQHRFQLLGDLTLHGVTRPTTWDVTATFSANRISGTARTQFGFAEFNLQVPRVAVVLSVQDSIRLEYDFAFER